MGTQAQQYWYRIAKKILSVSSNTKTLTEAVLAIHQDSGGLLRKANLLARGSLIRAAIEKTNVVTAEHVRIASTELI